VFDVVGYEEHCQFKTLICGKCRNHLPVDKFGVDNSRPSRRWKAYICIECRTATEAKLKKEKPGQLNRTRRAASLKRYFGLTLDQFEGMVKEHNGVCGCCGKPPREKTSLCVDHDHKSGKIRGLLCSGCNRSIGQLGDTIEGVERTLNYLKKAI
jgi:hypothetical protein